jgi:hypothetical protein
VELYVRKLQKRIYLASKNGEIKKVRKLPMSMIKSYNAKLLATRRATQDNKGKKIIIALALPKCFLFSENNNRTGYAKVLFIFRK